MNKLFYCINLLHINVLWFLLRFFVLFKTNKKTRNKRIAFLPYTPIGWYGGDIRIANWKKYFEAEGYQVDVIWAWEKEEMLKFDNSIWLIKYVIYSKVCYRRFKCFFKLYNYQSIWIQRAFVPIYPFKDALFEKLLNKAGFYWVVDFYDPDYQYNPKFVNNVALNASCVTVANDYLQNYFEKLGCKNVSLINMTIDTSKYLTKKDYKLKDQIIIGWMGSSGNAKEIFAIKDILIKIQQAFPNVYYHFISNSFDKIEGLLYKNTPWDESVFFDEISEFDIGIIPIGRRVNDSNKGKVAMKSIEMMAIGLPIVCSKYGVSNFLIDGENALMVNEDSQWLEKISNLISDNQLRSKIGINAAKTFKEHHSYSSNYPLLKHILCYEQ